MTYTIQRGDTLSALAKKYNTTVSALKELNNIRDANKIYAGDTLLLPESGGATAGWSSTTRPPDPYAPGTSLGGGGVRESEALRALAGQLTNFTPAPAAEYRSAYADRIAAVLDSLENREAFSYDYSDDPLYAQYKDSYTQGGKLAMQDAMGNAAALTGGYGSSYAQGVGQQTYQSYLRALGDKIPELAEGAYQKYAAEEDALLDQLAYYGELDAAEYQKYRDSVEDEAARQRLLYEQYRDAYEDEYRRYQSQLDAWYRAQELAYRQAQDEREQNNWERQFNLRQSSSDVSGQKTRSAAKEKASAEAQSIYALFETMTGDERRFMLADSVSLNYIRSILGDAGLAALKAQYAGKEK